MKTRSFLRTGLIALALVSTLASAALAQRPYGQSYGRRANVAGEFDYYVLVMSWSPSYCAGLVREGYDPQCDRSDGKRYNFVLHGAWPQYAPKGWPEECPVRGRAFVPRDIINSMLDIMPSDKLVIHEYRKHGTCSGLSPSQYFALARSLFRSVNVPAEFHNPMEARFVSLADLYGEFHKVNPWLRPEMMAVDCNGNGNRLREVRFCFTREGQPRACTRNEDQGRMCRADKVYMPPVRASRVDAPAREDNAPLPRPRMIPSAPNN